jgi:hypothetical protein
MKWIAVIVAGLVLVALAMAEGEIWEEDDHEVLIRSERGAKNRGMLSVHLGRLLCTELEVQINSVASQRQFQSKSGRYYKCTLHLLDFVPSTHT